MPEIDNWDGRNAHTVIEKAIWEYLRGNLGETIRSLSFASDDPIVGVDGTLDLSALALVVLNALAVNHYRLVLWPSDDTREQTPHGA